MRYGYIMEGMTPGTEDIMAEKMRKLGCDTVVMEKAYNGFKRVAWKGLTEKIRRGDELMCYDLAHLASDYRMLRELRNFCNRQSVTLYTMEGLREEDGLVNQSSPNLLDGILSFLSGEDKRTMAVIIGLREQIRMDFPHESKAVQEKIYACFCLAEGVSEGYFYQATGKSGPEFTRRINNWMTEGYRKELNKASRKRFEDELERHIEEARRRNYLA